jgi:hypothetical protein
MSQVIRILFTILLVFTLLLSITTNEAKSQSLGIGVTAGVNTSTHLHNFRFAIDDIFLDLSPKISTGYNAGIIIRQGIHRNLRFQAEPGIAFLGAKYDDSFTLRGFDFQTDSETELIYVQLPLLLQLTTSPSERTIYGRNWAETTYHLTGGIFGGYLLDGTFSGTNSGAPIGIEFQGNFSNDITNQYTFYDAGVILGGGLEHGLNSKFGLEARLMFSVLNSGDAPQINFRTQNMAATLSFYFLL